mmetsp:Transcript_5979/g.10751  ORF Transcript_5979/g.10751 Transcript_5979/m.10751 type:complete len:374 (+) Transcript_5979:154-1275(+)|eukprot:CAMPEP_0197668906 /NCGR_PEP_ID=MMETSP1338-20131121/70565_1 /TAXON_ID=43686 ORGANISM="Pelagodinium beii, Strain RCC1491" /NCGR_SAMPLE_ID=MMETSP1338 /ASSEMBLY_ACC=CAM_ASM_000754 /LENGTH=373 /DNA_ID=CAMNT_0043248369 /DNA_START=92 /DNA_END=1213 /DNA_ORIENTATION=+
MKVLDPATPDHAKHVVALYSTTGLACLLLPTPPMWKGAISLCLRSSCASFVFFAILAYRSQEHRRLFFLISVYCNSTFAVAISVLWPFASVSLTFILVGNACAIAFYLLLTVGPNDILRHTAPSLVCSCLVYQSRAALELQPYAQDPRRLQLDHGTTYTPEAQYADQGSWDKIVIGLLSSMLGVAVIFALSSRVVRGLLQSQARDLFPCLRPNNDVMRLEAGRARELEFVDIIGQPAAGQLAVQPVSPISQDSDLAPASPDGENSEPISATSVVTVVDADGLELLQLEASQEARNLTTLPLKVLVCARLGFSPEDSCLICGSHEVSTQTFLRDLHPQPGAQVNLILAFHGPAMPRDQWLRFDSEKHRKSRSGQ